MSNHPQNRTTQQIFDESLPTALLGHLKRGGLKAYLSE